MKSKQGTAMVMAELSVMQKEMDKRKQLVNHLKVTEKENEDTLEKHKEQIGVLASNGMTTTDAPEEVVTKMVEIGGEMMKGWRETASPEAIAVLDAYLEAR